jgi:hypothetical protein
MFNIKKDTMKALLVKKTQFWYNLYHNNVGIGSTHESLQDYTNLSEL